MPDISPRPFWVALHLGSRSPVPLLERLQRALRTRPVPDAVVTCFRISASSIARPFPKFIFDLAPPFAGNASGISSPDWREGGMGNLVVKAAVARFAWSGLGTLPRRSCAVPRCSASRDAGRTDRPRCIFPGPQACGRSLDSMKSWVGNGGYGRYLSGFRRTRDAF